MQLAFFSPQNFCWFLCAWCWICLYTFSHAVFCIWHKVEYFFNNCEFHIPNFVPFLIEMCLCCFWKNIVADISFVFQEPFLYTRFDKIWQTNTMSKMSSYRKWQKCKKWQKKYKKKGKTEEKNTRMQKQHKKYANMQNKQDRPPRPHK